MALDLTEEGGLIPQIFHVKDVGCLEFTLCLRFSAGLVNFFWDQFQVTCDCVIFDDIQVIVNFWDLLYQKVSMPAVSAGSSRPKQKPSGCLLARSSSLDWRVEGNWLDNYKIKFANSLISI